MVCRSGFGFVQLMKCEHSGSGIWTENTPSCLLATVSYCPRRCYHHYVNIPRCCKGSRN